MQSMAVFCAAHYNSRILRVFLTQDYYVVGVENGLVSMPPSTIQQPVVDVYLVSRTTGQQFWCCRSLGMNSFTVSDNGYIYYVGHEDDLYDGVMGLYRVTMATLQRTDALIRGNSSDFRMVCPTIIGNYVYTLYYMESTLTPYGICGRDVVNTGQTYVEFPLSTEINAKLIGNPNYYDTYFAMNIDANNTLFYVTMVDPEGKTPTTYKVILHEDGTMKCEQLDGLRYAPNVIYYNDGTSRLYYMGYDSDKGAYILYYQ